MKHTASNFSIGDRESPLEANPDCDVSYSDPMIGEKCEVSTFAGGSVANLVGSGGTVTGVIRRLGRLAGYQIKINGTKYHVGIKDVFVKRQILEDVQVFSPMACAVREALMHWNSQHEYWGPSIDGIEDLCFEVASITPIAKIVKHTRGWQFQIPEPMGGRTIVDCLLAPHDNFWTLTTAVYSERASVEDPPEAILDHWARTMAWTHQITSGMNNWEEAVEGLEKRAKITAKKLRPLLYLSLGKALREQRKLTDAAPEIPPGSVSIGLSLVRLQPRTLGLTEPPTDRRPYTVMSISPDAAAKGDKFMSQVVLHECVHVAVGIRGGAPHNDDFKRLAKAVGLPENHSH